MKLGNSRPHRPTGVPGPTGVRMARIELIQAYKGWLIERVAELRRENEAIEQGLWALIPGCREMLETASTAVVTKCSAPGHPELGKPRQDRRKVEIFARSGLRTAE